MGEMREQGEQSRLNSSYAELQAKKTKGQMWNPWHGCHKKSEGCQHCYVYHHDRDFKKDCNIVTKTACFNLPIRRDQHGNWKVPSGVLMCTCFISDFFIEEADEWREDVWKMMKQRNDLSFFIVTKRPERIVHLLPKDWGDGYENVSIGCTIENQRCTDERLPIFRKLPIRHKSIICQPLLEFIDFQDVLGSWCEQVTVGGESGIDARICDYDWVLNIREQCVAANVPFHFKQTGAHFRKEGRLYNIPRNQQMQQALKANINFNPAFTNNNIILKENKNRHEKPTARHLLLGQIGEELAANWLVKNGFRILHRNWKSKYGYELDIVALKDYGLHIVEVKTRTDDSFRQPYTALNYHKIRRLQIGAGIFKRYYRLDYDIYIDGITILYHDEQNYKLEYFPGIHNQMVRGKFYS